MSASMDRIEHSDARRRAQAVMYHIVTHGARGFEVQPPIARAQPQVFNQHKDETRNWHAALKWARSQPWAMKRAPFQFAALIGWGYETRGDFDEALRIYADTERTNGAELDLPADLTELRAKFAAEFEDFAFAEV